jgi:hypothetical protein
MRSGIFVTPRPVPRKRYPLLGGGLVLALALPVFLVAGWDVAGWALGALLWTALQIVDVFLARFRGRTDSLAASGVLAFGLSFKSLVVLAVVIATAASRPHLAVAAALVFALAYTFELGLSLLAYFGAER